MSEMAYKLRQMMAAKSPTLGTKDTEFAQKKLEVTNVLRLLANVSRPPGYAKALNDSYNCATRFASAALSRLGETDVVERAYTDRGILEDYAADLNKAAREASNPKLRPMVFNPTSLMASILGIEFVAPEDGEWWPTTQREGPRTWQSSGIDSITAGPKGSEDD